MTRRCDVDGAEIGRSFKQALLYRLVPAARESLKGGPEPARCLRLWGWHLAGRFRIAWARRVEWLKVALVRKVMRGYR
ncbi:MAG: hypothetical protein HY343_02240 [Lentisphaerae bacterium]|nr:hypothetical protein [Lentisphaerota bacterium]